MSQQQNTWVVKDSNGNIVAGPTTLTEAQQKLTTLTESSNGSAQYSLTQLLLG